MNEANTIRLLKYVAGELSAAEASALEAELETDNDLLHALERVQATQLWLARTREAPAFEEGFAQRVMARVHLEPAPNAGLIDVQALRRAFARVAPAALAASAILGGYTLFGSGEVGDRSKVEVLFGLPAVTLEAAYTLDVTTLVGLDGGTS